MTSTSTSAVTARTAALNRIAFPPHRPLLARGDALRDQQLLERVLLYASALTIQRADPWLVTRHCEPLLAWLALASDRDDLEARAAALDQQYANTYGRRGYPADNDPDALTHQAALLYEHVLARHTTISSTDQRRKDDDRTAAEPVICTGCGQEIPPGQKFIAYARHVEEMQTDPADGSIYVTVHDAQLLDAFHPTCEPADARSDRLTPTSAG
jgi:hypothetical protein